MRNLIKVIASNVSKTNGYTQEEEEEVEYGLRVFTFEALKIIGAIIIFSLLGYGLQAIIVVGTMSIVKPFIGGYHEENQIRCFTVTLLVDAGIIYLSNNTSMNFIAKVILGVISLYCIWQQAPIINPKMPLTREELIRRNRVVGVFISAVFIILSVVLYKYRLISNILLWTMAFQALLMFNKRTA